jgi:hypothetical protein
MVGDNIVVIGKLHGTPARGAERAAAALAPTRAIG